MTVNLWQVHECYLADEIFLNYEKYQQRIPDLKYCNISNDLNLLFTTDTLIPYIPR